MEYNQYIIMTSVYKYTLINYCPLQNMTFVNDYERVQNNVRLTYYLNNMTFVIHVLTKSRKFLPESLL